MSAGHEVVGASVELINMVIGDGPSAPGVFGGVDSGVVVRVMPAFALGFAVIVRLGCDGDEGRIGALPEELAEHPAEIGSLSSEGVVVTFAEEVAEVVPCILAVGGMLLDPANHLAGLSMC